jgi:TRAP-type C4-dicarboxylate transport system permease small subunit
MNANGTVKIKLETRVLLSTLWIVVMINMLKADILSLFIPGTSDELVRFAGETPIAQLMLGGAIIMEVAIVMIILSRVLPYRANRWANIIVSVLMIVFVIGGGSSYPHYIFIATVEVICLLLIIWSAWKWRGDEVHDSHESSVRATARHSPSA